MKHLTALTVLTLYFLLTSCQQEQTTIESRPPNFIIIFADDMGYGDIGAYGHPTIKTPNLDRMATEGQKWTQFYVAAPVCTPSRAALLTGRYPIRNGMTSTKNGVLFPNSVGGLPQSELTIAEVLKQKDYATAMIGKWHLGHRKEFLPNKQGFDYYFGIPYSNDMDYVGSARYLEEADDPNFLANTNDYNVPLMENDSIIERPADQMTITKRYTEKAVDFIEANRDEPFFIYLAHSLPHIPLFASEEFLGSSKQGLYGDVIQEIDWGVGQIMQSLEELGLDDNTIVVFTSDNGPWLRFKTHGGSAGPLRAGKGTTFEGGQRVPGLFWGPGLVEPGVVDGLGSTLDLINTFASLSGTDLPDDRKLDGFDLSPVLENPSTKSPRWSFYYWTKADLFAIRVGPYKLHFKQNDPIVYWRPTDTLKRGELYNLEADIGEKYNLLEDVENLSPTDKKYLSLLLAGSDAHQRDITDPLPDNLAERVN